MKHFITRIPATFGRIAVAYIVPGTAVAQIVADFPGGARSAAQALADRLTVETEPLPAVLPPEERHIPSGFYADQGNLF